MNINQRGQRDFLRITTNPNGGGTSIIFVKPDNSLTKTIYGMATKHMLKIDENGFKSIGKNASVVVSEAALNNAGYPTRNAKSEISLLQHKVTWTDVSGLAWTYTIRQTRPDETIGAIVCILDDYDTPVSPERIITGWGQFKISANIVAVPDPSHTQALGNALTPGIGDVIPLEYALNADKTLTIAYLVSINGIQVLTSFTVQDIPVGTPPYAAGTFNNAANGGFSLGDKIEFDASLPIWSN